MQSDGKNRLPSENGDSSLPRVDRTDTVAHAVEVLRDAPKGRIGVTGPDGAIEAELWLSDPGLHDEIA